MIKSKPCKECGSIYHTKMYHNPKKPIKRSVARPSVKKAKTPTKKKPKAKTRSYYVKQLDKVFSLYIRQSKPPICVTCGKRDDPKNLQNGHYYSRGRLPTRWHEDNCYPQCAACNIFKSGNYTEYALFMLKTHGESKLRELHQLSISGKKITTPEIREKIEYYKQKLL